MAASFFVDLSRVPTDLRAGVKELADCGEYPLAARRRGPREVRFLPDDRETGSPGGYVLRRQSGCTEVRYRRPVDAFRALGQMFGGSTSGREESTPFSMLGVMVDCSRNAVLTVETARALLRRCALMGVNLFMLYTEDTYEVPGEPLFGYLRGAYTREELKDLDEYAARFGIEMMPCIQTLAHLQQVLKWDAYRSVRDTSDVLLVGEKKTYELLQKMIVAASAPYRSRSIHVGMDEAHGLGSGAYRNRHGDRRVFDVMTEHLVRVCSLCRKAGLRPMMWDDMFFRIGSRTHDYYDPNAVIPEDVIRSIPEDLDLVYWDYYHTDENLYRQLIGFRKRMGKLPVVAPGAWNWGRFWSALPFAYERIAPCIRACRDTGVREVFITLWGDDGNESDCYSALPAIQCFADLAYGSGGDRKRLETGFRGSCHADLRGYEKASELDTPPGKEPGKGGVPSKWLLWDDPLLGMCEPYQAGLKSLREHYAALSVVLARLSKTGSANRRLLFPARHARVLSLKCECRKALVKAYRGGDRRRIGKLLDTEVRPLLRETRALWKQHRRMWLETYKPFGLEVLERRYGCLLARLDTLQTRLKDYRDGRIARIPEFETTPVPVETPWEYRRISSPSSIY